MRPPRFSEAAPWIFENMEEGVSKEAQKVPSDR